MEFDGCRTKVIERLTSFWETLSYLEVLCLLSDVMDPFLGLSNEDGGCQCHAALTCSSKGCAHQLVDGVLPVGVGHDDSVVLGSHVALYFLAVFGAALVNVLAGYVAA